MSLDLPPFLRDRRFRFSSAEGRNGNVEVWRDKVEDSQAQRQERIGSLVAELQKYSILQHALL